MTHFAYLFDLDGTLLDSNGVWQEVDRAFLERRGLPYTKEYFEGVAHTIFPLAAQFTKDYCGLADSCQAIMDEWLSLAGEAYAESVPLKANVLPYLEKCRRADLTLSLVTSCLPQHAMAALERLGLTPYFHQLTFAQPLGMEKRDPAFYRLAAAQAAVPPQACTVFDDSLSACQGAKAAGMYVVGVHDPFFAADAPALRRCCHRTISNFAQLC